MSLQQQQSHPPAPPAALLTLSSQFWGLRELSPTVQQLVELQDSIDQECLAHTQHGHGADAALSSGTIVEITLYLSSPLVRCHGADSHVFREVQLRALIAAFALLLHTGVTELTAATHDQLRRNLANRFNDVSNVHASSLEDRMGKATASYLIRLAAQYFWLFKRAQPLTDALPFPVLGLVVAGVSMAGGQYNSLRSVFQHADEVIGLIQWPKSRYLNLPALQEITRRATTSLKTSLDVIEPEITSQVANDIKLVQELLNAHFRIIPSRKSDPWEWPLARLRLGPPSMNAWNFFYGLLDCAAQVSHHIKPEYISSEFSSNLKHLMAESEFEEFRWKIREILSAMEEKTLPQSSEQQAGSLPLVDAQLASEKASSLLISEPSTRKGLSPATTVASDEIQSCLTQDTSVPVEPSNEADSVPYVEEDLTCWRQDGDPRVDHLLTARKLSQSAFHRGYSHAGLSPDCSMAFFHNDAKVRVYRVNVDKQGVTNKDPILEQKYGKDNKVVNVSLSDSLLVVSTHTRLEFRWLAPSRPKIEIPHGDWEPSGLAIHEDHPAVLVSIGHHRQKKGSREGLVTLYNLKLDVVVRPTVARKYNLPMRDIPKSLRFDSKGESLTCVTDIRNLILVWKSAKPDPFVCSRYRHRPETGSDGVTSAIIYNSRSEQSYILCSTSASTERYVSKGEWPFASPVTATGEEAPSSSVHDFDTLQRYRYLIAGAVSSVANVYAVLEKTGKIVILRLTGHEEGGICSRDEAPLKVKASLCGTSGPRASTSCMRFDPSGKRLFAVDPEGTLLVVTFRPEDGS